MTADASALYNAGTLALEHGRIGEAVAFLTAARRLDPRAPDIRRNLSIAERAVSAGRGESAAPLGTGPVLAVSAAEGWWLAALVLAVACVSGILAMRRPTLPRARLFRRLAITSAAVAAVLGVWLGSVALEERRHPEAVVVAAHAEARPGIDEPPRAPVLLRAGEYVRVGRTRGEEEEILLGGSSIGWVARAAVWHVSDAPRYTRLFGPAGRKAGD